MKRRILFFLFIFSAVFHGEATVWQVGPTRTYTKPSQVSTLVQNGDTVEIDAGNYPSDVCRWTAHNLLLKGVGGYAQLESNGLNWGDKGIWVIQGNNNVVEWIEFSECTSTSQNGAGIRHEGLNLTVRHCYFHNNEDGILVGAYNPSKFIIEYTEFAYNGYGDGFSHNLYIGNIDTLVFRYNYSHHCSVGHELKSRARVNYILYNRFSNEASGTASREIDLPNGGLAIIMGNIIQQGVNGSNSNLVGYGLEGLTNPSPHNLYMVHNTLVNEKSVGTFVSVNPGANLYKGYDNIFSGGGSLLNGTPAVLDTMGNKYYPVISSAGFVNSAGYDYRLLSSSSAVNASVSAGTASNGYSLTPVYEYVHPADKMTRFAVGPMDIGAHEYGLSTGEPSSGRDDEIRIFISYGTLFIMAKQEIGTVSICDLSGKLVAARARKKEIPVTTLPEGIYIVKVSWVSGLETTRTVKR